MKITRETLRDFTHDFKEAMAPLEEKYDASITIGTISFTADMFSTKLEVKGSRDPDINGSTDFDYNVWKYEHLGFREGMYKRIIIGADGNRYAVIGFNTRAKKSPIIMIRVTDGARVRAGVGFIKEITEETFAGSF